MSFYFSPLCFNSKDRYSVCSPAIISLWGFLCALEIQIVGFKLFHWLNGKQTQKLENTSKFYLQLYVQSAFFFAGICSGFICFSSHMLRKMLLLISCWFLQFPRLFHSRHPIFISLLRNFHFQVTTSHNFYEVLKNLVSNHLNQNFFKL